MEKEKDSSSPTRRAQHCQATSPPHPPGLTSTSSLQISSPRFRVAWSEAAVCARASLKYARNHSGQPCVTVLQPGVGHGGKSYVRSSSVATSSPSIRWMLTGPPPPPGSSVPTRSCLGVTIFREKPTARGYSSPVSWLQLSVGGGQLETFPLRPSH